MEMSSQYKQTPARPATRARKIRGISLFCSVYLRVRPACAAAASHGPRRKLAQMHYNSKCAPCSLSTQKLDVCQAAPAPLLRPFGHGARGATGWPGGCVGQCAGMAPARTCACACGPADDFDIGAEQKQAWHGIPNSQINETKQRNSPDFRALVAGRAGVCW